MWFVYSPTKFNINHLNFTQVNNKKLDDGGNDIEPMEYEEFDVAKANVYQYGVTLIYVLYGQLQLKDEEGDELEHDNPYHQKEEENQITWIVHQNNGILKCYIMLAWCVDKRHNQRLNYDESRWNYQQNPNQNKGIVLIQIVYNHNHDLFEIFEID